VLQVENGLTSRTRGLGSSAGRANSRKKRMSRPLESNANQFGTLKITKLEQWMINNALTWHPNIMMNKSQKTTAGDPFLPIAGISCNL